METEKLYSLHKISNYVGDDRKKILEMITLFLETIPPDLNQLPKLAEKADWQSVYKIAHKIKPSFDIFAMSDMHSDLRNIEVLAREDNKDGNLVSCIQILMEKVDRVFLLLQAEVDELDS